MGKSKGGDWFQSPSDVLRWTRLYLAGISQPQTRAQAPSPPERLRFMSPWSALIELPGLRPWLLQNTHCTQFLQHLLKVVGLQEGGLCLFFRLHPTGSHGLRHNHQFALETLSGGKHKSPPTTHPLGSLEHTNPSNTVSWQFDNGPEHHLKLN